MFTVRFLHLFASAPMCQVGEKILNYSDTTTFQGTLDCRTRIRAHSPVYHASSPSHRRRSRGMLP